MQKIIHQDKIFYLIPLIYTLSETIFGKYVTLQRLKSLENKGSLGYSEIEVHTGI